MFVGKYQSVFDFGLDGGIKFVERAFVKVRHQGVGSSRAQVFFARIISQES